MATPPASPTETLDPIRREPSPALARGTTVGRYVVLALAGEGAHGRIYAAWDPQLDRKVALKVLRSPNSERARQRLLREAKALAQLAHPNVLSVHDAGFADDQVYLATELVEGISLHDWLGESAPSRRRRLRTLIAAGRGLAAAHREQVVHGDFKPANVMVGRDGRPRVVDFGLARRTFEADPRRGPGPSPGTPSYMAPELLAGAPASAASDQYAFCVSLWRALGGAHPATGEGAGQALPKRLRRLLERGLALDPSDRWPDLDGLLDALEHTPRRTYWIGAASLGLGLLAVGLVTGQRHHAARELCRGSQPLVDAVWNESQRQSTRARLTAVASPALAATTAEALDQRFASWVEQRTDACRATHQRGEQSAALLDRRMSCLDRRLDETAALVTLLAAADSDLAARAPLAVAGLPPLAACADRQSLDRLSTPVPTAQQEEAIVEVRRLLAETIAHTEAGRWERGYELAQAARDAADDIGFRPLSAESQLRLGILEELRTEPQAAESSLTRALFAAQAGRDDRTAVEAFTHLARVVGYQRSDIDRGLAIAGEGRALLELVGERRELDADLTAVEGTLYNRRGDLDRATDLQRRAVTLQTEIHGADHPKVGRSLARLANVVARQGASEEAEALTRQALEIYERSLGDEHPRLIALLTNLGNFAFQRGDADAAEGTYRRAASLALRHHGRDHPKSAAALASLANLALTRGRPAEALPQYREALEIYRRSLGEEHPITTSVLSNLGSAHIELGDIEAARRAYRQALEIVSRRDGAESFEVATLTYNLAEVDRRGGEPAESLPRYERALSLWRAQVATDDPLLAYALTGWGEALIDLEREDQALPLLEEAVRLRAEEPDPALRADSAWALARALHRSGRNTARAHALAQTAYQQFRPEDSRRQEVAAWLQAAGRDPTSTLTAHHEETP